MVDDDTYLPNPTSIVDIHVTAPKTLDSLQRKPKRNPNAKKDVLVSL